MVIDFTICTVTQFKDFSELFLIKRQNAGICDRQHYLEAEDHSTLPFAVYPK
jgi:hypothetical protein